MTGSPSPNYEHFPADNNAIEQAESALRPHLILVDSAPEDDPSPVPDIPPQHGDQHFGDWRKAQAALTDEDAFEALHEEFAGLIRSKASVYFLPNGDAQDLVQEATIGFYKGIKDYDGRQSSLRNFLELCISRQVITAVKTSTRKKHDPLNQALSFDSSPHEDEDPIDIIHDVSRERSVTPEDTVIAKEALRGILQVLAYDLSNLESEVIEAFVQGHSYKDIGEKLDVDPKAVDNALLRVKRKIKQGQYKKR